MSGYFGIGIFNAKKATNLGTLWRSAHNFGAAFIFTIGRRYKEQASDTTKAWRSVPCYGYLTFDEFSSQRPKDCMLIGVEQSEYSRELSSFAHPKRAIYLLGAEDTGLPLRIQAECNAIVHINTPMCLNVATAGSIVMYARSIRKFI